MEIVVGVEGNVEDKFEDCKVLKASSGPSSPKQIADPVVYKLVRVEGDGRLVPATDDEVMEVENLLDDDKSDMHSVEDTGQNGGCRSEDGLSSERSNVQLVRGVDLERLDTKPKDIVSSLAPSSSDNQRDQSESGLTSSAVCTDSKPDFSKLQGEICLDKLSVKELHETFKATFGRETSVKDKQWLKRRIAMALANSCDVTTTTFVIEDNGLVKKVKAESSKIEGGTDVGAMNNNIRGSAIDHDSQLDNHLNVSGKGSGNSISEHDDISEDRLMEQRAAKRVRKPTRRYIEEISDVESREYSGKLISPVRGSGYDQSSLRSHDRPIQNVQLDGKPVVTRQDSLGGSGVQVPYVSRVRRCRPRKNYMALMKLQPNSMGMAAKLVKKALGVSRSDNNEKRNSLFKVESASSGWIQQSKQIIVEEPEKDEHYLERRIIIREELEKEDVEEDLKCPDLLSGADNNNSDEEEEEEDINNNNNNNNNDNNNAVVSVAPTVKGGMRRKHHRPWTLSEVVKLVEGVARYGAGRWSEIKRLAFASYSYRTAVDLKDKWRNLLRASFVQLPAETGITGSRKHASMPIPATILSRVRELAEMQSQVTPSLISSSRFSGDDNASMVHHHEKRSGYL